MNDVRNLVDVETILSAKGYKPVRNDDAVHVPVGSEDKPFPCVIIMDDTSLIIHCKVTTWGNIKDKVDAQMREDFFLGLLDLNSQTLPYAFAILSDLDGEEEDDRDNWPLVLTDSMPVGDISEEELLDSMRKLQAALMTAKDLFNVAFMGVSA